MEYFPAIELLESTHDFPCRYTFKAIGRTEGNFVGRVLVAVRHELREDAEPPFMQRKTSGGRHVCVTIEPTVGTAAQVIDIYRNLQKLEGLVMLL